MASNCSSCNHVNANYKELRNYFADFEGKKELIVDDDDVIKYKDIKRENLVNLLKKLLRN